MNTAHHEAGHAVANVVLGQQILGISIKVTEKEYGYCEADSKPGKITKLEDKIVTVLAAQFAEALHDKPHNAGVQGDESFAECLAVSILKQRKDWEIELTDDQIKAASIADRRELEWQRDDLRDRNRLRVKEFLIPLRERAKSLIQEHEQAVRAVAQKLLQTKEEEIVGEEAHRMVEEAINTA